MRPSVLSALVALLMGLAWAPPAAADAPPNWKPGVRAATEYLKHRAGNVSFAVRTERAVWGRRRSRTVHAASVMKPMLMTAYLNRRDVRRRALSRREKRTLAAMIRRSDNLAASWVNARVGAARLRRLGRRAGMRRFTVVSNPWGSSRVSAGDQARFFLRIGRLLPRRHRAFALEALQSIVPSQRWGVARVRPPGWELFFKGGWGSGSGAVDHQVALLRRGRLRVGAAVMTTGSPSHAYASRTLRGVFRRLLSGLGRVHGASSR